jgi:tripartite-type tricarboxylate transporter receptor subunit TctC
MAGVDMVGVAFRGSNEARTAVIGGQVPIMFDGIPTMMAQIEAGRVRALATTALRRDPALPDLPAVAELVPGFAYPVWIGLMMPAGTPPPIVARLHDEVTRIMTSAAGQAAMRRLGAQPLVMTIPEFDAHMRQEIESLAILARKANLRAE